MISKKSSRLFEEVITITVGILSCCAGSAESYRSQLNYTIGDNSPAGMTIGQVGFDSELTGSHVSSSTLTFSLITSRNRPATLRHLFGIDKTSGRLYTRSDVDRDVICAGRADCVVQLTVQVRAQGRSRSMTFVKVIVKVKDENDNRPTFDRPEAEVNVTEAALVGSPVAILPRARDLDAPPNDVRRYFIKLQSHPGKFAIDHDQMITGSDVYLVARASLDREQVPSYSLILVAVDGGSPALSGSINIRVRVTDVDDNRPVFERSVYHATLPEDSRTGSTVTTVRAVDADIGSNGEVVYSLVRHADQLPFRISSTSGLITTSGELDYESSAKYTLTVRASSRSGVESGSVGVAAHAQVLVHVTDLNDNAPTVVIATVNNDNRSHVVEASPSETFIAHISVVDVDPVDRRTDCQLNNTNFRLEKLFDDEFQVDIITFSFYCRIFLN